MFLDCHSIRMNVQLFLPNSVEEALTYSAKSELCFSHQKYVIAAEDVGIQRAQQVSLTLATKFQDLTQQGKITCGVIMWSSPSKRLAAS